MSRRFIPAWSNALEKKSDCLIKSIFYLHTAHGAAAVFACDFGLRYDFSATRFHAKVVHVGTPAFGVRILGVKWRVDALTECVRELIRWFGRRALVQGVGIAVAAIEWRHFASALQTFAGVLFGYCRVQAEGRTVNVVAGAGDGVLEIVAIGVGSAVAITTAATATAHIVVLALARDAKVCGAAVLVIAVDVGRAQVTAGLAATKFAIGQTDDLVGAGAVDA